MVCALISLRCLRMVSDVTRQTSSASLRLPRLSDGLAVVVLDESGDHFLEHPRGVVVIAFLVTAFVKPFTSNRFGNWFSKQCNEAGLKHCSTHGCARRGWRRRPRTARPSGN